MFGMQNLPTYITGWNYSQKGKGGLIFWEAMPKADIIEKANMFNKMNTAEGASHVAMFLSILQDSYVNQANY